MHIGCTNFSVFVFPVGSAEMTVSLGNSITATFVDNLPIEQFSAAAGGEEEGLGMSSRNSPSAMDHAR